MEKLLHESSATSDFPTLNQNTTGSAKTLLTARTFSITGDGTASGITFNGGGDVALNMTLDSNVLIQQS